MARLKNLENFSISGLLAFCLLFVFALLPLGARAAPGDIITIAGGGVGDGGSALSAFIQNPSGVTVDNSGNIYIADTYHHRIRKVDVITRTITTIAGNSVPGYAGDGGPAASALLNNPYSVAVDASGNIYIADSDNHRIRKIDVATGIITTIAGDGTAGNGGDGGPAISAQLNYPHGVSIGSFGDVYIADSSNHRIRKVDSDTGIITTVAGSGIFGYGGDEGSATALAARLANPWGVFVDTAENLYIADFQNNRIRKVAAVTGIISTVAGSGTAGYSGDGGLAASANLNAPRGVSVDYLGDIYIADASNHRIRKVDAATGVITSFAGNGNVEYAGDGGAADATSVYWPNGVCADSYGNIFIADTYNHRIRKVASGIITSVAGNGFAGYLGDGEPATVAGINSPYGVSMDASGNIYIADNQNHRIRKVDGPTGIINTIAGNGKPGYSGDGGPATSSRLFYPEDIAIDVAGNIFIADRNNNRIRKVNSATGIINSVAGNGVPVYAGDGGPAVSASLNRPGGVFVDTIGNIYIADTENHRIRRVASATGNITTVAGNGTAGFSGDGGSATSASLNYPSKVSVDALANIYIADTYNHCIRKVDAATGIITTVAGNGTAGYSGDGGLATLASLDSPGGVSTDFAGNIYIADTNNQRIRKVEAASGIIISVGGDGSPGYRGDGVPATSTSLFLPRGISVDAIDNIYIADSSNLRIRKVIGQNKPVGAININSGATYTNINAITLTLFCTSPESTCQEMQFSNDSISWSVPEVYSTSKILTLPLGDGTKTVYVKYKDAAGSYSPEYRDSIVLDTTPPTVTINSPSAGAMKDTTPLLSYSVSEGAVTVKVDGMVVNKVSGNSLDPLVDGMHMVRVEASDPAGNIGFAERIFTVDTVAPTVTINSPSSGYVNSNKPLLAYTVSDGTVYVKVDGSYVNKVSGNTLDYLTEGQHKVRVEAGDSAGNVGFSENTFIVDTIPPAASAASKVAAGDHFTMTIKSDGALWASGINTYGQLGNGSTANKYLSGPVVMDKDWVFVAAGSNHAVAIKSNGTLWAWGYNWHGQIGDGTHVDKHSPVQIGTDHDWIAVSAGGNHTLALKSNGTLWAWGENTYGELGDSTTINKSAPVQIGSSVAWSAVVAGKNHTIARKSDGSLWGWGLNHRGQIGDGTTYNRSSPVPIGSSSGWASIAAGGYHTLGIKSDGTLWAWGNNYYGQLGDGSTTNRLFPVQITPDKVWVSIAAGDMHSMGLKSNGTLWTWGYNYDGQLGDGTVSDRHYPAQRGTDTKWSAIDGGDHHTAALKTDGTQWGCGENAYGQLGDGTAITKLYPIQILAAGNVSLNNGTAFTNTFFVTVNMTAVDANGVAEMQFSNDGAIWSIPEPYATTKIWTLEPGDGTKTVYVKFKDNAGNWSAVYGDSIVLDTISPVVSIISPASGITNDNTPLLTYSVSDGPVVVKVNGMIVSKVSGESLDVLTDGLHTVRVESTDAAGNTGFAEVTFTVDTVSPIVNIASPASGITKNNAPLLTYTVSDGNVVVKVDGMAVSKVSSNTLDPLSDGSHTVRVESSDAAGNIGFAEVIFTVDTTAPVVAITLVTTPTNVNSQTITGTMESGATVTVAVSTAAAVGPVTYPSPTTWNCMITGLVEGTNSITVTATDAANNSTTAATSIIYDSVAPTVSIASPAAGIHKDNTPLLTYTVNDVTTVVKVDGVTVNKVSGSSLDTLSDGPHTVRVESTDAAGNTGFAEVTFIVDTVPPSVSINPVTTPTNVNSQTITGNRESGVTIAVTVNTGAAVGSIAYPTATTWTCTISGLAGGANTFTVTATDAAANSATATASITHDAIAPVVVIASPTAAPTNDNTPLLTYTASDGIVIVKVDGNTVSKMSGNSLDTLADGTHTVRVESTDVAGNIGFAEVSFTVDTAPPTISINPVVTPTKLKYQAITGTRESGAAVTVSVNTAATPGPVTYPSATIWSCTISNLVYGVNTITATANDAAGNTASATASITERTR